MDETNAKPWPGLPRHAVGGGRAHRLDGSGSGLSPGFAPETTVSVAAFAGRLPQRRGLFVLVTGLTSEWSME